MDDKEKIEESLRLINQWVGNTRFELDSIHPADYLLAIKKILEK
jgi:hypothetical protein